MNGGEQQQSTTNNSRQQWAATNSSDAAANSSNTAVNSSDEQQRRSSKQQLRSSKQQQHRIENSKSDATRLTRTKEFATNYREKGCGGTIATGKNFLVSLVIFSLLNSSSFCSHSHLCSLKILIWKLWESPQERPNFLYIPKSPIFHGIFFSQSLDFFFVLLAIISYFDSKEILQYFCDLNRDNIKINKSIFSNLIFSDDNSSFYNIHGFGQ